MKDKQKLLIVCAFIILLPAFNSLLHQESHRETAANFRRTCKWGDVLHVNTSMGTIRVQCEAPVYTYERPGVGHNPYDYKIPVLESIRFVCDDGEFNCTKIVQRVKHTQKANDLVFMPYTGCDLPHVLDYSSFATTVKILTDEEERHLQSPKYKFGDIDIQDEPIPQGCIAVKIHGIDTTYCDIIQ